MVFNRRNTVTNRDLFESGAFIKCVGSNRLQCARKRDTLQILALLERSVADRLDRDTIDLLRDDHLRDSIIAVHDFALFHIHINITARDRTALRVLSSANAAVGSSAASMSTARRKLNIRFFICFSFRRRSGTDTVPPRNSLSKSIPERKNAVNRMIIK